MDMLLPKMKYQESAYQREVVPFLGLNYSDSFCDGELASARNLSHRRYPYLSPRKPRGAEKHTAPSALFSWDGKLVLVDGSTLLYDGEAVGTVSAGEKQFAVVNTKLCIWPDKAFLDLKTKDFGNLAASVTMNEGTTAEVTENSITIDGVYSKVTARYNGAFQIGYFKDGFVARVYSSASWSQDGGWVLEGEKEVCLHNFITAAPPGHDLVKPNDIIMLTKTDISGNWQLNSRRFEYDISSGEMEYGSYGQDNDKGYFALVVDVDTTFTYQDGSLWVFEGVVTFQVLNAADQSVDLTTLFSPGDRLSASGFSALPDNNTKEGTYLILEAVSKNTLTFAQSTLSPGTETGAVTIQRPVPQLDYICERENRLWGVSNQDKTVYASALGSPKDFYTFDGLSTDSYAVAVGSEGDFTGICKYANAVLCWKERALHKILGSFPAEYQMASYQYAGVRAGAYKSIVNLNEVLFYLGSDGIYAFSGGAPTLLSRNFGQTLFSAGVAGSDGRCYWLSYQSPDGAWSLVVYDPATGLWLREDESHALDFCRLGDKLLFLAGDTVCTVDGEGEEPVEWQAQFTPFYETVSGRKRYSRLFLRLELPKGSWLRAEMRCDGGAWERCGEAAGAGNDVAVLPLLPNRCDKFELRLSGRGPCALLSLLREFRVGGER